MKGKSLRTVFLFLLLLGGLGLAVFLFFPARERRKTVFSPGAAGIPRPGGEGVILEIFSSAGRRIWHLRFKTASLTQEERLAAQAIRGEYCLTDPPARFTAAELRYDPDRGTLSLSQVQVRGPAWQVSAGELLWKEGDRSLSLEGGYTLRKEGTIVTGERLQIEEDFSSVRALGPVRLHLPMERSGTE
ncbi:MAG: hypothetical protein GX493_00615 [Firmicutes bacterium]|nr:hypothetical protein [Bacillota bacterium]